MKVSAIVAVGVISTMSGCHINGGRWEATYDIIDEKVTLKCVGSGRQCIRGMELSIPVRK